MWHCRLGKEQLESCLLEKDLECWSTQQCAQVAKKASDMLACVRNNGIRFYQQDQGSDCPPVHDTDDATPRIICSVLGHSHRKDIGMLQQVQGRAMELVQGLEHKTNEEQLRLLSLEKRRLRGDFIACTAAYEESVASTCVSGDPQVFINLIKIMKNEKYEYLGGFTLQ
ncbi:hypothetical protein HGM15179_017401 [Zosterops borbonicus]|uniref:Uncharacterized protein n=1 Tax=Zosterops borbonicus TaxID=364589 RepID=A0A8K1G0W6_9PASS|nr:hypothetical protein HGM15179_017401 [Zosterops borbonicus]